MIFHDILVKVFICIILRPVNEYVNTFKQKTNTLFYKIKSENSIYIFPLKGRGYEYLKEKNTFFEYFTMHNEKQLDCEKLIFTNEGH